MSTAPQIPPLRQDLFTRVAAWTTHATGGRWGFICAAGVVVLWAFAGPFCDFSSNWQLVINTGTTIVTFLMVFLIQNAQNRESKAIHLKLDELILSVHKARNELMSVEKLTEDQLDRVSESYHQLADSDQQRLLDTLQPGAATNVEALHSEPRNGKPPHMTVK
jgi:low affinity Fe/Cu permease